MWGWLVVPIEVVQHIALLTLDPRLFLGVADVDITSPIDLNMFGHCE